MNRTMDNRIKVAVIGVGHLGRYHARIYSGMEGVELAAVVDIDEARSAEVARECGCEARTRIGNLPETVDAVSIVVPTRDHLPVAREFLEKGVHAMIEKPLAPSVEEAGEIVEMARSNGAVLQVGHLERYNAGVIRLAEMAGSPRFIEVHRLGQFTRRSVDVDVVSDLMIHDIDIILSLVDSDIESVSASGCPVITDRVDIANARIEFANKAVANVTASRVSRSPFRRIRVFSRYRYLGLDFQSQQIEEIRPGKIQDDSDFPELVQNSIEVVPQLPLNAELEDFIDCVKSGSRPLVTGEEGLVAVRVAALIQERIAESMGD